MLRLRAWPCLPSVQKQKKILFLCFAQCKINQLLDSVFVIDIQDNQGLGKGYKPQPLALADNPYLDLDYTGYHKNLIQ